MYQKAWKLLLERIEQKTDWGKVELKKLMLECLIDVGEVQTEKDRVLNKIIEFDHFGPVVNEDSLRQFWKNVSEFVYAEKRVS